MARASGILILAVLLLPAPAYSTGEVFKVETSGTGYCGDFNLVRFNAANNIDLWVLIASDTELVVSLTPDFQAGTFFSMFGNAFQTTAAAGAFVAGQVFVDGAYVTIQGTARANARTGELISLSGTFIQNNLFGDGCFSSGKFKTVQRLL